ncbi:MAG: pyridoxamine 5'-phosphate oxidase family protein [Tatlockia sp.]|jgi:general stress protein 26
MSSMPEMIEKYFKTWFDYTYRAVYCQLANQTDNRPHVRTMRLYGITQDGCLEFLSNTKTQKWSDWQKNPKAALCFLNPDAGQILLEGKVPLKNLEKHPQDIKKYWHSRLSNILSVNSDLSHHH